MTKRKHSQYEPLLKSEAQATSEADPAELDATEAFDSALSDLNEDLIKARKTPPAPKAKEDEEAEEEEEKEEGGEEADEDEEDEADDEDDDEDEEDEPKQGKLPFKTEKAKKGKMKKSLAEEVAEGRPEAEAAMDVEPFLKALVETVDKRLSALESKLEGIVQTQTTQSKVLVAEGNLLKSALSLDEASLDQPQPRKSALQTMERFAKSEAGETQLTDAEARSQLVTLAKSGKLNPTQVSVIEGRLNKGLALPDYFYRLLEQKQS